MYILTKGQRLEWHVYFLTNQLDYNDLLDYIHLINLYNLGQMANGLQLNGTFSQNGQCFLVKCDIVYYPKYSPMLVGYVKKFKFAHAWQPDMHGITSRSCLYICITGEGAFVWYVYVHLHSEKLEFEIYISKNKRSGDSKYEFSLCMCCIILHI